MDVFNARFLLVDLRTVIFQKVEKNLFFLFYPPTLNVICFVEKKIEFLLGDTL